MERAVVGGVRIACRSEGEHARPAVVFSNSLASDHHMWDGQVAALIADFRIIRYDTRGHGASDAPEGPYSIDLLARDCLAVLDHFSIEKAHFVGLSLGGMVGQWLGAEAAERFHSLTLCDTASDMPKAVWDERIAQVEASGMASIVETTLERWFTAPYRERTPNELDSVRQMVASTSTSGYLGCAAAIRDMALGPLLGGISMPTRVIVGAEDVSTPLAKAQALNDAIAGSDLVVIPEAAHLPNLEQPESFNQALRAFLHCQINASAA